MDRCVACQYYDRQSGKQTDSRGIQWGQCRRSAPALHPINQKTYMIEGVWPHVRDDDWCGEWKVTIRRADSRSDDAFSSGPLLPIGNALPFGSRVAASSSAASASTASGSGVSSFGAVPIGGPFVSSGRGD